MKERKVQGSAPTPEVEPFPRGRPTKDVSEKRASRKRIASRDAARKCSQPKKNKAEVQDALVQRLSFIDGKAPSFVEPLRFSNIEVGAKVWGTVIEVTKQRLVISLPHGLRGFVAPDDAGDVMHSLLCQNPTPQQNAFRRLHQGAIPSLPDLFYPGQYVCTVIKTLESCSEASSKGVCGSRNKRVHLSLCLSDVCAGMSSNHAPIGAMLPACVRAVEAHGSQLTVGIDGVDAFLPTESFNAGFGSKTVPALGQLLHVVVNKRLRDGGALVVGCEAHAVASASLSMDQAVELGSILPGQRVMYFHGAVDQFHLPADFQGSSWHSLFSPKQRIPARILYVGPAGAVVRLSLLKHLLDFRPPSPLPVLGAMYENATVIRADRALGLLVRLPTDPIPTVGYVHISRIADNAEVPVHLAKAYPAGSEVRAKVVGFRPMDGLATLTMRPTEVDTSSITWGQLILGAVLRGTVAGVEGFGVLVQLGPGVRGLVPLLHMSDSAKPSKTVKSRFNEGQQVIVRVLNVSQTERKVTLTLKQGLLNSKLAPLCNFAEASVGRRAHGWVTGVTIHGIFVEFYGGLKGLVPLDEAPVSEGVELQSVYQIGQVVRCTVLGVDPHRGLRLSLAKSSKAARELARGSAAATGGLNASSEGDGALLGGLQPGDVVPDATVTQVVHDDAASNRVNAVYVMLNAPGGVNVTARLPVEHLSDHPHAAEVLAGVLQPGMVVPEVLVLELRPLARLVVVTRKAALISEAQAGRLPSRLGELQSGQKAVGYIASVTHDACFVRFGGSLTGRAGLSALADTFITDPAAAFAVGQTVQALIGDIDEERARFGVILKPSQTADSDAALLSTYFRDVDLAAKFAGVSLDAPVLGSSIAVHAQDVRPYGTPCDIEGFPHLVGLLTEAHMPDPRPVSGETLRAVVLDVQPVDGILDLSASKSMLAGHEKAAGASIENIVPGTRIDGFVQLIKQDAGYMVVSLAHATYQVAFVPTLDFNLQRGAHRKVFKLGQKLALVVAQLLCETGSRLLLSAPLTITAQAEQRGTAHVPVTLVQGTVAKLHDTYANVNFEKGKGRLHATEIVDIGPFIGVKDGPRPLLSLEVGQESTFAVYSLQKQADQAGVPKEVSLRPSVLAAAGTGRRVPAPITWKSVAIGMTVMGVVQEVHQGHLVVALSSTLRGHVHVLQASSDPELLTRLHQEFHRGEILACTVTGMHRKQQQLDLSLLPHPEFAQLAPKGPDPAEGDMVMARVTSATGRGVQCTLANGTTARVALTDLHDSFVPNALEHLAEGLYVRSRVLAHPNQDDSVGLWLSLRESQGCKHAGQTQVSVGPVTPSGIVNMSNGDIVDGYVRSAAPQGSKGAGVFVSLSAHQHGRAQLRALAAHFVDDPANAFPEGQHVQARVVDSTAGRIELSLKAARPSQQGWLTLESLQEGQVVQGIVKRIERFGVFVLIASSSLTALAHVSELDDVYVNDPASRFHPGCSVRAVVMGVDRSRNRVNISMRPSALSAACGSDSASKAISSVGGDHTLSTLEEGALLQPPADAAMNLEDALAAAYDESDSDSTQSADSQSAEGLESNSFEEETSVTLASGVVGDVEEQGVPVVGSESGPQDHGWQPLLLDEPDGTTNIDIPTVPRRSRRDQKSVQAQAEAEIRRRELARLKQAAPASTSEFEQLLTASPGSSYVWIQYMAWLLSSSDIAQARAVAERALARIDFREEAERFNVWLAFLNLEARYADDPANAAAVLLQRALQHTDAKRMYLAAIDAFKRAGLADLVADCSKAVRRKEPQSCKVWLRCISLELDVQRDPSSLIERALAALPVRKHVKFLSRVGLVEFKVGSAERGRAVFERLVAAYPKRTDLWGMYIDQEMKAGTITSTRNLFERAVHLALPPKKMRYFFKRYVEFEAAHGGESRVAAVKQKALEFLQNDGS